MLLNFLKEKTKVIVDFAVVSRVMQHITSFLNDALKFKNMTH